MTDESLTFTLGTIPATDSAEDLGSPNHPQTHRNITMSTHRAALLLALTLLVIQPVSATATCSSPPPACGSEAASNYPCCSISIAPAETIKQHQTVYSPVWIDVMAWGGSSSLKVQRCATQLCSSPTSTIVNIPTIITGVNKFVANPSTPGKGFCDDPQDEIAHYLVTFEASSLYRGDPHGVLTWSTTEAGNFPQKMVGFEANTNLDQDYNDVLVTFSSFANSSDTCASQ